MQITHNSLNILNFVVHIRCAVSCWDHLQDLLLVLVKLTFDQVSRFDTAACVFSWVWMEALSQPDVETAVGVGGFGYPVSTLVTLLPVVTTRL